MPSLDPGNVLAKITIITMIKIGAMTVTRVIFSTISLPKAIEMKVRNHVTAIAPTTLPFKPPRSPDLRVSSSSGVKLFNTYMYTTKDTKLERDSEIGRNRARY